MSYTNRSGDQRQPDMPAVSPLDMPVGADQQKQPRRRIAPKSPRQVLQPETAPPPPPRSQKARHPLVVVLNFFLMVVVLVVLAGGAAFYFGSKRFSEPGPLGPGDQRSGSAGLRPRFDRRATRAAQRHRQPVHLLHRGSLLLQGRGQAAGRRISVPGECQHGAGAGRSSVRAFGPARGHVPRGVDEPGDRGQAERRSGSDRRHCDRPAGRLADAGDLQVHARPTRQEDAR